MQTFLPFPSFRDSAECLDYRRLGKQRVEVLQLLKALRQGPTILYDKSTKEYIHNNGAISVNNPDCVALFSLRATPWYNHPACQMWKGYELTLSYYGEEICEEWIRRGFKDTCFGKIRELAKSFSCDDTPPFIGNEAFHRSHKSNLIRKNPALYSPKFPGVPSNLEYIWAV